jgi:hypothetical protein
LVRRRSEGGRTAANVSLLRPALGNTPPASDARDGSRHLEKLTRQVMFPSAVSRAEGPTPTPVAAKLVNDASSAYGQSVG